MWECRECNTLSPPAARECIACQAPRAEAEVRAAPAAPVPPSAPTVTVTTKGTLPPSPPPPPRRPAPRRPPRRGGPVVPPPVGVGPSVPPPPRRPTPPPRTPTPRRRPWSLPLWVSVAVLAIVVIVVAATSFGGKSSTGTGDGSGPTPAPTGPTATSPTITQEAPSSAAPSESPAQYLQDQAASDQDDVEARLVGAWVPQISSKNEGLDVGGHIFTEQDVADDHRQLRSEYPDVRLVWSGDYSSFKGQNFWVTIVGIPFSTADEANAWCDAQNLTADQCFAKRLSHTEGPQGNTKNR